MHSGLMTTTRSRAAARCSVMRARFYPIRLVSFLPSLLKRTTESAACTCLPNIFTHGRVGSARCVATAKSGRVPRLKAIFFEN